MLIVLLPCLLLLVTGEPTKGAKCMMRLSCIQSYTDRAIQLFVPMFKQLSAAFKEMEDDQDMVTPSQVGSIFVDWTDPQKAM